MKKATFILLAIILLQACKVQQVQTDLPKVENHLNGELDYTHEALKLVQRQSNGKEISLGKINADGTIHFYLPEFNIKALYDSIPMQPYPLQDRLLMTNCTDKDNSVKPSFDDIYSQEYKLFVKKYGTYVAILEAVDNEEKTKNNGSEIGSTYSWFYIDRAIDYKEECIKTSFGFDTVERITNVNIQFEKGWNFIEKNQIALPVYVDYKITQPQKVQFAKISPTSKKVKWFLRQIEEDEKIQIAKKLDKLTPVTKELFKKWVPNELDDLSLTTSEHGNPPRGLKNKNNVHLIYANETQKKEIDLYVVDCAKNPDDLEMVTFAYAMENRGKEEKDIKPYVAQYNERKKVMNLMYKVDDRIFITASGMNINAEELWGYIQELNIEKLIKN